MRFELIDDVQEQTEDHIVVVKVVSRAEEYLADHFPTFPVLPGVMMIETMVQAARRLLASRSEAPLVMGEARAIRFGRMVRPGQALRMEVTLTKQLPDGGFVCRAVGRVRAAVNGQTPSSSDENQAAETAVHGRFTMRPLRPRT